MKRQKIGFSPIKMLEKIIPNPNLDNESVKTFLLFLGYIIILLIQLAIPILIVIGLIKYIFF